MMLMVNFEDFGKKNRSENEIEGSLLNRGSIERIGNEQEQRNNEVLRFLNRTNLTEQEKIAIKTLPMLVRMES
jgi:hypothetical protein